MSVTEPLPEISLSLEQADHDRMEQSSEPSTPPPCPTLVQIGFRSFVKTARTTIIQMHPTWRNPTAPGNCLSGRTRATFHRPAKDVSTTLDISTLKAKEIDLSDMESQNVESRRNRYGRLPTQSNTRALYRRHFSKAVVIVI